MAQSTTEAEFISASLGCREVLWLQQLLSCLDRNPQQATQIFIDNQGAIKIIQNHQINAKTKHIDIKYMFIRHAITDGKVITNYINTSEQIADILTKAV